MLSKELAKKALKILAQWAYQHGTLGTEIDFDNCRNINDVLKMIYKE